MKLSKTLITAVAAVAAVGFGAGVATADDGGSKFENNSQVLSCLNLEVVDIPILSAANNNIDCSENTKEQETNTLHIVEDESAEANIVLPRGEHKKH